MKKTVIKSGKLTLKKETLIKLSDDSLSQVQGGIVSALCTNNRVCARSTDFGNTHTGVLC